MNAAESHSATSTMGRGLGRRLLVERDAVVAALTDHAAAAAGGRGRLVLVRGEAGIGKTSVVQEFTDQIEARMRVVTGFCDPLSTPVPLGPVVELMGQLGVEWCRPLAAAVAGERGPGAVPPAVAEVLAAAAPVVWVIEDAHWADGASLDVLRYVGRRTARMSALVLVTYRDDEVGPLHPLTGVLGDLAGCAHIFRMDVPPLSLAGVQVLAAPHPGVDAAALHAATGGNPFFVTEALATGWTGGTPVAVRESVLGRLSRLSPAARRVADVVAVLGPDATPELVEAVSAHSEAALSECIAAGIVDDQGEIVEYRHELARQAVCDAIPAHRRRKLHGAALTAVALASSGQDMLPHLAFHAEEAADIDAVLLYAPAAADQARALGAHRQAVEQYARALRHAEHAPPATRAGWWERRAYAAYLCGLGEQASQSITEAARLRQELGDQLRAGDDLRFLSHLLYPVAPVADVRAAADQAIALLEPLGRSRELAWAYANRTQLASMTYDWAAVARYAPKAVDLGRELGDEGVATWARVFEALATILDTGGDWSTFDAVWRAAKANPATAEHAGIAGVVAGLAATQQHNLDAADRYLPETTRFCRDNNLPGFGVLINGSQALAKLDQGRFQEAETIATGVLSRQALSPLHYLWAQVAAATARARCGRDDVWRLLDTALACHDPDDLMRTGIVWTARIEAAWLAGNDSRAQAEAQAALTALTAPVDGWIVGRIAGWAQIAGAPLPALPRPAAGPYARQLNGQWDAAADEWDHLGCPYQAAIARMHSTTPGAPESALAGLAALGAHAAETRARQRLRAQRRHGTTRADPHGLTTREREVAQMLVARYTDREIAQALFISPKTASHHVSAVLAKLGVTSRAAVRTTLPGSGDDSDAPGDPPARHSRPNGSPQVATREPS